MERRFEGKVALVTGATNGIGRATAVRLASEGALVGVNQRPTGDPSETLRLIREAGGDAFPVVADMRDPAAVTAMVGTWPNAADGWTTSCRTRPSTRSCPGTDVVRGVRRALRDQCARRLGRMHRGRPPDGRRGPWRRDRDGQSISAHVGRPSRSPIAGPRAPSACSARRSVGPRRARYPRQRHRARRGGDEHERADDGYARRREVLHGSDRPPPHRRSVRARRDVAFLLSDDASYVTSATLLVDAGFIVNAEL